MRGTRRKFATPISIRGIIICSGAIIAVIFLILAFSRHSWSAQANIAPAHRDPRIARLAAGTTFVSEVPTVLPEQGVTINAQFVLRKLTTAQTASVKLTANQAIKIARTYVNTHPFAATTLLTNFTSIGSVPPTGTKEPANIIENVPAWIVTFTNPNPQSVIQGKRNSPRSTPTHFSIVINANTGAFVLGFFTS
ncbi:MAG: hypothetical protein H0W02_21070 [Ktedonobacteraceae bacterium]|nr:hypothetical protein [Ktedonobacteraceae bacterium]